MGWIFHSGSDRRVAWISGQLSMKTIIDLRGPIDFPLSFIASLAN